MRRTDEKTWPKRRTRPRHRRHLLPRAARVLLRCSPLQICRVLAKVAATKLATNARQRQYMYMYVKAKHGRVTRVSIRTVGTCLNPYAGVRPRAYVHSTAVSVYAYYTPLRPLKCIRQIRISHLGSARATRVLGHGTTQRLHVMLHACVRLGDSLPRQEIIALLSPLHLGGFRVYSAKLVPHLIFRCLRDSRSSRRLQ